jgi:hypothetical protein
MMINEEAVVFIQTNKPEFQECLFKQDVPISSGLLQTVEGFK